MTLQDDKAGNLDELIRQRAEAFDQADKVIRTAEMEGRRTLTQDERDEYDIEFGRFKRFDAKIRDLESQGVQSRHQTPAPNVNLIDGDAFRGDPFQPVAHESIGQLHSRALRSVELWRADDELKEGATRTLERLTGDGRAGVAEHVLVYGSPAYSRAFAKWTEAPDTFMAELEPEEHRAWVEGQQLMRATLQTSGAVLPSPLDPSLVLSSDGSVSPMREICRIETTDSKTKRFITTAGSTFSFDAELTEVSDDTHTETEVEIETHKAQGWIEASLEVSADQPEFAREVAKLIADGKDQLEADKFVTGTGTNEPTGLEVELAGGASEVSPATAEVFASADVYSTIEALPPRFRPNARWMAELSTINQIDQFETTNGAKLFPQVGDASPTLLRRRLYENSAVDAHSDIDVGATASNLILYVGDFSKYVILDRVGLVVSHIPFGFIMGASERPTGKEGWYAVWRTGGESLVDAAFRVLNIATTA